MDQRDAPADDFDPTRLLDGWGAGTKKPGPREADPTRVLDGWVAGGAPASQPDDDIEDARVVIDLPRAKPPARPMARDELAGIGSDASRLAASLGDVQDVEAVWQPSGRTLVPHKARDPRLLTAWRPGAWLGAVKRVLNASAEVVESPQGPVVEAFPPHQLLALWPPQELQNPFVGRWPAKLLFVAVDDDDVGAELLAHIPDEAPLWLAEREVDWGAIGELALLHQPSLRGFQLKGLRAFVEAERDADFKLRNDRFHQPVPGAPVQRKAE